MTTTNGTSRAASLLALFLLLLTPRLSAQNIMGGSTGDPSAVLDLRSSSKGLLLPRMTTEARSAIANPAEGLLIYNTTLGCIEINLGSSSPDWVCLDVRSGRLDSLQCGSAIYPNRLEANQPVSEATALIPYMGGNGGAHNGQTVASTGVTGLTASLYAGVFASGSGQLLYTISGTPSTEGTASFAISIGGRSCTLQLTVISCKAFVAAGVEKRFLCHNLGANTNVDPLTPSWELIGNYYQWGRKPSCFGRDGTDAGNPCSSPVYGAAGPWGSTTANDNAGGICGLAGADKGAVGWSSK